MARHRRSETLEAKDIQLALEKQWNLRLVGVGDSLGELKVIKKVTVTEAHKGRVVDVDLKELHTDPMAAVRRIYDAFGLVLAPASEAKMRRWLADNGREKHGKNAYDRAWFGVGQTGVGVDGQPDGGVAVLHTRHEYCTCTLAEAGEQHKRTGAHVQDALALGSAIYGG